MKYYNLFDNICAKIIILPYNIVGAEGTKIPLVMLETRGISGGGGGGWPNWSRSEIWSWKAAWAPNKAGRKKDKEWRWQSGLVGAPRSKDS